MSTGITAPAGPASALRQSPGVRGSGWIGAPRARWSARPRPLAPVSTSRSARLSGMSSNVERDRQQGLDSGPLRAERVAWSRRYAAAPGRSSVFHRLVGAGVLVRSGAEQYDAAVRCYARCAPEPTTQRPSVSPAVMSSVPVCNYVAFMASLPLVSWARPAALGPPLSIGHACAALPTTSGSKTSSSRVHTAGASSIGRQLPCHAVRCIQPRDA